MSRFTLRLAITLQAAISAGDGLALIALANRVYAELARILGRCGGVPCADGADHHAVPVRRAAARPAAHQASAGERRGRRGCRRAGAGRGEQRAGHARPRLRLRRLRRDPAAWTRRRRAATGRRHRDRPGKQLSSGGDLGRVLGRPAAGGAADLHRWLGRRLSCRRRALRTRRGRALGASAGPSADRSRRSGRYRCSATVVRGTAGGLQLPARGPRGGDAGANRRRGRRLREHGGGSRGGVRRARAEGRARRVLPAGRGLDGRYGRRHPGRGPGCRCAGWCRPR